MHDEVLNFAHTRREVSVRDKFVLRVERNLLIFILLALFISPLGVLSAEGAPIAVFPFQQLGVSRNDVNLEVTRTIAERLEESGNEVVGAESMMAFMGMHRIRSVGFLDSTNISRFRRDLGAAFILFGTITESKNSPEARIGLILHLVRTSDMRKVWTSVYSRSRSDERNILAIAEPTTIEDILLLLIGDLIRDWPWQIINEEQFDGALKLDAVFLSPLNVRPGGAVACRIRLKNTWGGGQPPRVFFKADEQIYPATASDDGVTFEAQWVARDDNGRVPVTLVLDWPMFERSETALLGNYLVDGTLPLFKLDLRGVRKLGDRRVADKKVVIIPQMIVKKQLERWRLSFYFEGIETVLADMEGAGNLPNAFQWEGMQGLLNPGDGTYQIKLEVWDKAGNIYQVTEEIEMLRSLPEAELAVTHSEKEVIADLDYEGKVPLSYWRLEMWTEEGKILTRTEGQDLPVSIDVQIPEALRNQKIEGVIFLRDVFGKESRKNLSHFLPKLSEQPEKVEGGISKDWVDEF